MKTALVTGPTSYLGLRLVERLMSSGVDTHALVRPTSDLTRLSAIIGTARTHVYDGALTSLADAVSSANPEVVFHIAGTYAREHDNNDIDQLIDSNIRLGTHLLEAMSDAGVRRIVNAGSTFQHFHNDGYLPLNLYAATKQAFADVLAYYEDARGIMSVTIKLPDVYGPNDWRPKLMNRLVEAHLAGQPIDLVEKSTQFGLIYIDDARDAFIHCARTLMDDAQTVSGQSFALDEGLLYTLEEVVAVFTRITDRTVLANWGAYPIPARSITIPWKGTPLPDWRAKVTLEDGVKRLVGAATRLEGT